MKARCRVELAAVSSPRDYSFLETSCEPIDWPDGFYLDAARFETCVRFGSGWRIILSGVEIQLEPSRAPGSP